MSSKTIYYVYTIKNSINSKVYYGKTNNPDARWKQHLSRMNSKEYNSAIYSAMKS